MKPWALLPIKETANAKKRLSGVLSAAERQELALAMLEDVVTALTATTALAGIAFVTADATARSLARQIDARVIEEGAGEGHTGAVLAGTRALVHSGVEAVVTLPLDVPLVTPAEIDRLVAAHRRDRPAFTIAPAHDRLGSNAVLRSPPESVPLRFGDDSFHPHLSKARQMGIEPTIVSLPGLELDIDHPADLATFMAIDSTGNTRRLLDGLTVMARLRERAGAAAGARA